MAQDPNIRCAATPAKSVAIPFERIQPRFERVGPSEYSAYERGPRTFMVISDSTMWPAAWHGAVDSVTTAPVDFGDGVLILVATQTYRSGPTRLRVTAIRQCRETGVLVVTTLETRPRGVSIQLLSRGLDIVRIPGRALVTRPVLFDQHLKIVP
jgi:hypothetical protein